MVDQSPKKKQIFIQRQSISRRTKHLDIFNKILFQTVRHTEKQNKSQKIVM
jgi:hypothetical protein